MSAPEFPTRPLRVVTDAGGFSLFVDSGEFVRRGLTLLFALPFLLFLLIGLIYGMIAGDADVGAAAFLWTWAVLSGASAVAALPLIVGARHWAARASVRFDGAQGLVQKAQGAALPLGQFRYVRARQPSQVLKWCALELVPQQGAPFTVYGRFAPRHREALSHYAQWLGSSLHLPVQIEAAASPQMNERTAACLCYVPVQGIFIGASLYFVAKRDRRPLVHFSARQSLCQTLFSFVLLILLLVCLGVPLAVAPDGPVRIAFGVLLAVSLVAFVIWNVGAHLVACLRAYRGTLWVMPWLRPFVRRWLPSA